MPCICFTTNLSLDRKEKERLSEKLSRAIVLIPGKSVSATATIIRDDSSMTFAGNDAPTALVQIMVKGHAEKETYRPIAEKITEIASSLGIKTERVNIAFSEFDYWAFDGKML